MIVEDDLPLLYSISFTLKRQKYQVDMSSNGIDGLRHLLQAHREGLPFHILITDSAVPGLACLGLIDRLNELNIQIPVIVITANSDRSLIAQLEKRGIRELLPKPFTSDELLKRISSVLDLSRLGRKKNFNEIAA
jgi:DNA-binding response OmpR family regulator